MPFCGPVRCRSGLHRTAFFGAEDKRVGRAGTGPGPSPVDSGARGLETPPTFTRFHRSPPLTRTPLSFISLAVLILAGWQIVATLSRTPAFNGSLQVDSPEGRNYTGFAPPMYDRGRYYQWMANGWRGAGTSEDGPDDAALVAQARQRVRDIATEGLRHAPGDPTSWMFLAEAEAALGQPSAALGALKRAYELAPQSAPRAAGRMVLVGDLMEDPEGRAVVLADLDPGRVDADLKLLVDARYLAGYWRSVRESLVAQGLALSPLPGA